MALETLKDVKEIGGYPVVEMTTERDYPGMPLTPDQVWKQIVGNQYILVDHFLNSIWFRIQNGPIKEVGVNGCQVDTLIETAIIILEGLDAKFPCKWNAIAIKSLKDAVLALDERKAEREARGVEGTSNA